MLPKKIKKCVLNSGILDSASGTIENLVITKKGVVYLKSLKATKSK